MLSTMMKFMIHTSLHSSFERLWFFSIVFLILNLLLPLCFISFCVEELGYRLARTVAPLGKWRTIKIVYECLSFCWSWTSRLIEIFRRYFSYSTMRWRLEGSPNFSIRFWSVKSCVERWHLLMACWSSTGLFKGRHGHVRVWQTYHLVHV